MSKIYEALLRAELERADKTGAHPNGVEAAERALANTREPYVPEPQPQFQELPTFSHESTEAFAAREQARYASPVAEPLLAPIPPLRSGGESDYRTAPPSFVPSASAAAWPETSASRPLTPIYDPNWTRVMPWTPVMERLPALTERGRSVEQFRSLRSRLTEFRDSSVPLKSLLVTSGLPQEGKSFIAANLALSLSRHRANRVLLIDGDIRRSSLHAMLGTSAEPGLTEYLSGKAELSDVLQRCQPEEPEPAFHNGLSSLTFIAGGSEPDKAADLSGSPRFSELLETLGPHFDWIVIDSSPVNLVSDGVNFARVCDGVLMVAREGVTKFETAQTAQQQLKSARILGFVLNAVHTSSAKTDEYNYGPYGTYGSYGGYGYSTTKR